MFCLNCLRQQRLFALRAQRHNVETLESFRYAKTTIGPSDCLCLQRNDEHFHNILFIWLGIIYNTCAFIVFFFLCIMQNKNQTTNDEGIELSKANDFHATIVHYLCESRHFQDLHIRKHWNFFQEFARNPQR